MTHTDKHSQVNKFVSIIYISLLVFSFFNNIPTPLKNAAICIITLMMLVTTIYRVYKDHRVMQTYARQISILKVIGTLLLIMLIASIMMLRYTNKVFLLDNNLITVGMIATAIVCALLSNICLGTSALRCTIYAIYINYAIVIGLFTVSQVFHLNPQIGILKYIIRDSLEIHELAFIAGIIFVYMCERKNEYSLPHRIAMGIIVLLTFKRISIAAITVCLTLQAISSHIKPQKRQKLIIITRCLTYAIVFGYLVCMTLFFNETISILQNVIGINMNWRDQFYGYILTMPSPFAPILGAGIRSTDHYLSLHPKIGFISAIHSDTLRIFLENGLIIFIIYFVTFISIIPRLTKQKNNTNNEFICLTLFLYTFICYTTDNLFTYYRYIFVLFIIIFDLMLQKRYKQQSVSPTQKKKILIVDHSIDVVGGVERVLSVLSNTLIDNYDIEVLSEYKFNKKPFFPYDKRIKQYYLYDQTKNKLHHKGSINKGWLIIEKLHNFVIRMNEKQKICQFLQSRQDIDIIIYGRVFTALRFLPIINRLGIHPKIIVRDAIHILELKPYEKTKLKKYFPKLVHTFIVSSDESLQSYSTFFGTNSPISIVKIYNPLAINAQTVWPGFTQKNISAIGRIDDNQKGFDTLILAFRQVVKKHPDWTLSVYGDGSLKPSLQTTVNNLQIPNIIFHPYSKDIVDTLSKTSIFAFPSRYEGYANTLVEALACGIPSITFDWYMGAEEIIQPGKTGVIVKLQDRAAYRRQQSNAQDIKNFAKAICDLIEHEKKAEQYAKNAIKIRESRRLDKIIDQWENLIKN